MLKLRAPTGSVIVEADSPGRQLTVTVWTSKVPGSVNVPVSVVEPFSLIVIALKLRFTADGATLLIVIVVVRSVKPSSLSIIRPWTVRVPGPSAKKLPGTVTEADAPEPA